MENGKIKQNSKKRKKRYTVKEIISIEGTEVKYLRHRTL